MGKIFLGLIIGSLLLFLAVSHFHSTPLSERALIEAGVQQARRDGHELSKQEESILRIQLALVDHMSRSDGEPPNSLNELVGRYFESVPRDPETDKPFEYTRKGRSYELAGIQSVVAGMVDRTTKPTDKLAMQGTEYINPNLLPKDSFVYDPSGKRDPFLPFDFSARPANRNGLTPLEGFDIGQLRLTAVLADAKTGSSAIVEDASGRGYTVKVGTKMGNNNGIVVAIEKELMKILETNTDITGKETQRVVEMKIQPKADHHDTTKKRPGAAGARKKSK